MTHEHDTAVKDEMKPCPFCGGEAEFSVGKHADDTDWHYIECSECGAMGPSVNYAAHGIKLKETLAEAWNRRAALEQASSIHPDQPKEKTNG